MLQNVVGNASKFTPTGDSIVVSVARAPAEPCVELRVRDSGMGIAADALPYIFERYYQVRSGAGASNGLGLYFCRLAVEAHGGTIRAISQMGVGTSITISLPLERPGDVYAA